MIKGMLGRAISTISHGIDSSAVSKGNETFTDALFISREIAPDNDMERDQDYKLFSATLTYPDTGNQPSLAVYDKVEAEGETWVVVARTSRAGIYQWTCERREITRYTADRGAI